MRSGLRSPLDSWNTSLGCSTHAAAAAMSMPAATWSTGTTSRMSLFDTGSTFCPLSARYTSGADVVKPSFQPANGYATADSTIAGRTIDRTIAVSRATSWSPMLFVYV